MNIVYLLGNGFDINIGMNTRYSDFYEYYNKIPTNNEKIAGLKSSIKDYICKKKNNEELTDKEINWSDLEIAFGQYCEKFTKTEEFEEVYNDLVDNLGEYLENEENSYDFSLQDKTKLPRDLLTPHHFLTETDGETIENYLRNRKEHWYVHILTFNYTHSVERLMGYTSGQMSLFTNINNYQSYLQDIQHIHGYTDNRMILGVNDESQVNNEELLKNPYFRQDIIKSECNKAQKTLHVRKCEKMIDSAQIICLYGVSLGDTDNIWWQKIAEAMAKNNSKLLIFYYSNKLTSTRRSHKRQQIEDEVIESFLSKSTLSEEQKQAIRSNIFVSINSNIFNFKLKKLAQEKAG